MTDSRKWIANRVRLGWVLLAAGALAGYFARWATSAGSPYNLRIVIGISGLMMAGGVGLLMRFHAGLKDEATARRLMTDAHDERTVSIRMRAGNRAFWASTGLVFAGLMWVSYATKGGLPQLDADTLWYFLAAAMIIPFGVYIGSLVMDESRS